MWRSSGRRSPRRASSSAMPSHTVGTPAATVTLSSTSRSTKAGWLERSGEEDLLGPDRRRGVGHAPGVGVEHRHLREHGIARPDRHGGMGGDGQGMQEGGAMGVDARPWGARWSPTCSRAPSAASRRCAARVVGRLAGEEILVGDDARERSLGHSVVEDDDVAGRRGELRQGLLEKGKEVGVDQHGPVVGVLDADRPAPRLTPAG